MAQLSIQQTVTLPNGNSAPLVDAASDRVALIVNPPTGGRVTVSTLSTAVENQGLTVFGGGCPLMLTREQHGELVTRAWTAIYSGGTIAITVTSVFER